VKILLAVDGSPLTKKALGFLVANESLLAAPNHLHVLHVQPALPPHVKRVAGRKLVANYHQDEAEKRHKVHLIVMGTHGHGVLGRMLMGSVAQRVVSDGDLPVLLVK
jgi:nucleotide-binding universal stress UspA family protein